MYKLIISPKALKQLREIKQSHQMAVRLAFEDIRDDPTIGKALTRELIDRFSYRVSVYRIIYKINKKDRIVNILTAGHRASIYSK